MMFDHRSPTALIGLVLLVVAACLTAVGSTLLIMECMGLGFFFSLAAAVSSAVGMHETVKRGLVGRGLVFWTLLSSLCVLAYTGVVVGPWTFHALTR